MTSLTDQVLALVAGVLPAEAAVTVDTGLKRAGLSSLAATRLWFAFRKEFGVDIPVTEIGQCDTVRALAAAVARGQAADPGAVPVPASVPAPAASGAPFPLTELQQSYLVGKDPDLGDDPVGCHVYREFEISGLDCDRLAAAWQRVTARHGMLRATLTADGRQQVAADLPEPGIVVHDCTAAGQDGFAVHLAAVRERLSHRRYTAADWPLWTVEVSRGPGGRGVIHLSIDVIFIDGHGLSVLLDDWWQWYQDPDLADAGPLVTVQECLAALAAERQAPGYDAQLRYWAGRLTGLPDGPDLGVAAPLRPAADPALGCLRRTAFPGRLSRRQWAVLGELARDWETSPTALVLTLFAEALAAQGRPGPASIVLTTSHRGRLPAEADTEVGPFTSSIVFVMPDTVPLPLATAVRRTHDQLWADLEHATVGGVTALRRLRQTDRAAPAPRLPVVFTSMLGMGGPAGRGGFESAVSYALSQTTGVALDHQMWEQDGELHFRWDVVEEQFPPGAVRVAYARFRNQLEALTAGPFAVRELNELQQAYFVPRSAAILAGPAAAGSAPAWDGCQVYHSFSVDDLDIARLERAWLRLAAAHDVLRSCVGHDGKIQVSSAVPERWHIPVIDLSELDDPDGYLARMRDTMAGRALPLGRAPQCEVRVTVGRGTPAVHLLTDLTIIDGRSIHFLVRELFRLYADPDAVSPSGAGPAEYKSKLRVARDQPRYAAQAAHWRDRIAALPPGPRLRPGPADAGQQAADRARVRYEAEVTGWRAVREMANATGVTGDDLLAAAFSEVFGRRYGVPFAFPVVRWTPASMPMRPGEFTAMSWLTRDNTEAGCWPQAVAFRQVLDRDAAADGVSGLAELRKRVLRERRGGQFDLPVVYTGILDLTRQPLPPGARLGPWLTCTPDVSLDCITIEEDDVLRLYWDAVPAHFEPGVLPGLFAEYTGLVRGLTKAQPEPEIDRSTMLYAWNDTAVPFDDPGPAHLRFEEQARQRPDAVALRWTGGTMTYGELNRQANLLARTLLAAGLAPGTPVAVSVPRGPLMAVAVYGVLKAGCCYVPVEPSLPAERARTVLGDAQVSVVLTAAARRGWPVPDDVLAIAVDALPAHADAGNPPVVADSSALAYVIFTSGSTGKPKGVAVQHRPLHNLFGWCYRTHGFGPADVGLCVTSLGFDLSVFDLLGLLGCGAGLYIASEAEQKDPELLLDILLREPITFWNSAPAALNQLAPLFRSRHGQPGADSLRLVYLSGDYTPLPLPDEIRGLFPQARIVSLGGATEATVWSNWFEVGAVDPGWRSIPYGRPIDNARYYIVDERLEPCQVGVEGDLLIGGDVLSAGYYGQPGLTAERFIADPFRREPGGRLYRTGDRASYFPDGTICFLGRSDGQVKIRGFRVELGEIEHRLRAHPGVKDVVALGRPDRAGDRKLVAYVVPADDMDPPAVGALRQHAAAALPDYMVPNVVCFVNAFPATSNGKLDREALPWPAEPGSVHLVSAPAPQGAAQEDAAAKLDIALAGPGLADTAPADTAPADTAPADTALAAEIAEIFRELLEASVVGLDDDLWDLGATSYTMVQVAAALRDRHGRAVPVSVLLAEPTVAGIAREITAAGTAAAPPATARPGTPPVPDGQAPAEPAPSLDRPATPPAGGTAPADGQAMIDFFSAPERAAFKQARYDLRRAAPGEMVLPLALRPVPDEHLLWRSTSREFDRRPVPAAEFESFLGLLREAQVDGRARRLYPSAGDTYGVQAYLHIRPDGVQGLAGGLYYYHPAEHALQLIEPEPQLGRAVHFVYNRPVFDAAAFELYLFGQGDAVTPLYGEQSERFLTVEAGAIAQLLMLGQAAHGLGLCPIGSVAEAPVREQFKLGDGHRYLMAFLIGPVTRTGLTAADGTGPLFVPAHARPAQDPHAQDPSAQHRAVEIAVTGMAARLPGADDLERFWQQLSHGRSAVGPPPATRRAELGDTALSGGFLAATDEFDSLLFHVSPREAATLDPQLRMLLPVVWETLEAAGHTPGSLHRTAGRVGVFVGAMWHDFQQVGADGWQAGGRAEVSATASDTANRISHFFGFTGPSVGIDASCTSSLAALHLAAESVRSGDCGAAVVTAVNLFTHPYHLNLLADLGLLATAVPSGAFDAGQPGWTPGEGAAALLIRPTAAARDDGDQIVGLVEGTRIGHLGGQGRFGTPDAAELRASVTAALAAARVTPDQIGYVECAAAGAALADAAEIEALSGAFAGRADPLLVGTVKPNTGHLEAAAGLSQVIKVLLQFSHRQIAPTLLADRDNPLISLASGPLRAAGQLTHWRPDGSRPLRALVNSLGAGGSYGHVVLRAEEPATTLPAAAAPEHQELVVLLSAETPGQLTAAAGALRDRLAADRRAGQAPALANVAFTTQCGRVPLRCRLAVTVADLDTLGAALDAFTRGQPAAGLATGTAEPGAGETGQAESSAGAVAGWLRGAPVDWGRFWAPGQGRRLALPGYPFARERHNVSRPQSAGTVPLLADLPAADVPAAPATASPAFDHLGYLIQLYAAESGIAAERLHPRTPLEHYGLSSALIAALNARLADEIGPHVPKTLFFEHPDLAGIAAELARLDVRTSREPDPDQRIAVIGLAGRYPQAADLDEFWANLRDGRDSITPLPLDRRQPDWPDWPAGLMVGGFIDGVADFDPLFFGITPRDAALMDPQERLFLQVSWHALESAGYPRSRLADQRGPVGVFVGSMYNEYPLFGVAGARDGRWTATGSATAGIANRVSYFLGLHGPSLTVDTMCSSSLTALHLAVASLRRGECALAIAGGVNLSLHPNKFVQLDHLKMASSDHRCRSFGAGGDGFAAGEGVGAVLLKPLASALADGDPVHGVIAGSAVNHGGKTNGYTVPSPQAQAAVVTAAMHDAGVDPGTVGYLEAHGTGTALGDPVEIAGLSRAFAAAGLPSAAVAIGSVKSNIGHLEAAAGIAGLTKVLLQFRHDLLAPSLHAGRLNPNVDWASSPFRVLQAAAPWPAGGNRPRRAGISSFGAGGANAHLIVESHDAPPPASLPAGPQLAVLSARTPEQLTEHCLRMARFLAGCPAPLADIAYTLQAGREALRERLALVVTSTAELAERLQRYAAGNGQAEIRGRSAAEAETAPVRSPASEGWPAREPGEPAGPSDLAALARHWAGGGTVDWQALHPSRRQVVQLPGYPFARVRCWAPSPVPAPAPGPAPATVSAPGPASVPAPAAGDGAAGSGGPAVPRLLTRQWTPAPDAAPLPGPEGMLLCLHRPDQRALAAALAAGLRPATVLPLDPELAADLGDLAGRVGGVIDLCALGADRADEHDAGPWTRRLGIVQQVLAARPPALRVMQVTRGLLDAPGPEPDLSGARLAGFVRSLAAEYPWARGTVLDTDLMPGQTEALARQLAAAWSAPAPAGEACLRQGISYAPRLAAWTPPAAPGWAPDPDRVYLVTGGTRGLGALVAAHLVRRGARKLAIMGRRPLPPRHSWHGAGLTAPDAAVVAGLTGLERGGARIMTYGGPLTDGDAVGRFLADVRDKLGELAGVVHCAGQAAPGLAGLAGKDADGIRAVLAPKGDGTDLLAELTSGDALDFVVLFSSVSAVAPRLAAGMSDYAAANSYLNLLAGYQQRRSRPEFRAVCWPVWRDTGGGTGRPDAAAAAGFGALDDAAGLLILDQVLSGLAPAVVLPAPDLPGAQVPDLLLPGVVTPAVSQVPRPALARAAGGPPPRWLTGLFAESLGIPEPELDTTTAFGDLGVESVLLGELLVKLEARTGRPLEPTLLLDFPTIDLLAGRLAALIPAEAPETTAAQVAPVPPPPTAAASLPAASLPAPTPSGHGQEAVAVVGMACRFPGAPDLGRFWDLLRRGGCAVTEVPAGRWDVAGLYDPDGGGGRSISKWGGFVSGIEDFDPEFFRMSEADAKNLDPGIRMVLEVTASCLRDAGYPDEELRGQDVGVFIGARMSRYRQRVGLAGAVSGLGGDQNFIAAMVAQQYDFRGPNLVVDSACSSALVSVQLACRSLLAGESALAIAGGVEVLLDEQAYLEFTAAKALSRLGRCAAFSRNADGFVPGEGCGLLLLKPLGAALRDGDQVHAVIEAAAVANDGRTMGLTTPNPLAQAEVVRRALRLAGLTADDIGLVEAHGTATMIGDPIELRALTDAFRSQTARDGYCAIGSVKSNLGHLLSAAGIAGLIKALLALKHAQIPPTLFCDEPNPRFDFAASPFYPATELIPWPAGRRAAGVSAFGLGGTNAHVIATALDQAAAPARPRPALPAPALRRRRLWWDAGGTASPVRPAQPAGLVASLLDLSFTASSAGLTSAGTAPTGAAR